MSAKKEFDWWDKPLRVSTKEPSWSGIDRSVEDPVLSLNAQEQALVDGNKFIMAVKSVRERLGTDLYTAKKYCDEYRNTKKKF